MRVSVGSRRLVPLVFFLVALAPAAEPAKNNSTRTKEVEARLKKDVTFLASDRCEGRGPTTKGLNRAARYIAGRFKEIGLKPGVKGSYFQPFRIPGAEGSLVLTGPAGQQIELSQRVHFRPLGMDQKGEVSGPVVFAGFGIRSASYDDYAGLDVEDKVVVVLRDTPRPTDPKVGKLLREFAPLVRKLATAEKLKAKAVLVLNDTEAAAEGDRLVDYSYSFFNPRGGEHLPAFMVRRDVVEGMLGAGVTLGGLERRIHRDLKPASRELTGWQVSLKVAPRRDLIPLKNVVGVLEGSGPLANETVVVGAHYDHLGYGGASSLDRAKVPAIHHGADDNGSGTAGMIELALRFSAIPARQGRRLVFIAFSGEEVNLLGSRHYCRNPLYPLGETAAMFNLDMIGRLRPDKKTGKDRLLVQGTGSATPFKELIDNLAQKYEFKVGAQASGDGPSDHAEFYGKKVPVLFFWTDVHPDYHRPSDTADRLNVAGMRKVVDASEETVKALATMDRPAYRYVPGSIMARPSKGPRLSIRPSYFPSEVEGLEVDAVTPEGPADRAGMQDEDVIVSIAGRQVRNMATYMQAMSLQKKGTTIEVVVLRKGAKKTLKVKLDD
jgi:hypothetical protein